MSIENFICFWSFNEKQQLCVIEIFTIPARVAYVTHRMLIISPNTRAMYLKYSSIQSISCINSIKNIRRSELSLSCNLMRLPWCWSLSFHVSPLKLVVRFFLTTFRLTRAVRRENQRSCKCRLKWYVCCRHHQSTRQWQRLFSLGSSINAAVFWWLEALNYLLVIMLKQGVGLGWTPEYP